MCGIVGYVGHRDALSFVLPGLRRLEYRGYDSAGIVTVSEGSLDIRKTTGKIADLETAPRVPRGRAARLRRGPASKPREEGDGGMIALNHVTAEPHS
jgi:glutamine phosphoribosylpyrophosphate amidotransferase